VARKYGVNTHFIELAGEINTAMPRYVMNRVIEALNDQGKAVKDSNICVLGVAYKRDIDDHRESPGVEIITLLQALGARVSYNDPHIPALGPTRHHAVRLESQPLTEEFLAAQDCLVIVTDHSLYQFDRIAAHARVVVDTRNAMKDVSTAGCRIWKA
jgi:UDP-N-acetyl-D-glucosamine dehydrogenase